MEKQFLSFSAFLKPGGSGRTLTRATTGQPLSLSGPGLPPQLRVAWPARGWRNARTAAKRPETDGGSVGPAITSISPSSFKPTGWEQRPRLPNRWTGQGYCVHLSLPPNLGAGQADPTPANFPGAYERLPPVSPDRHRREESLPVPAQRLAPPATPALPVPRAGPRASGERRDPRGSPARPLRSARTAQPPRPAPRAYPWWRLRGLPATGERGVRREDFLRRCCFL